MRNVQNGKNIFFILDSRMIEKKMKFRFNEFQNN